MKRKHEMPFGAECRKDRQTRFRLWAPKASSVETKLAVSDFFLEMTALEEGWYETVAAAPPGTQYQFRIDHEIVVPDPASRFQPSGVHAMSEVIDPVAFEWSDDAWKGRPWHDAVIYELHVGTFTREGTFASAEKKLDYLADLGATAIEMMPVSSFPGKRNWGYDGVLPFAPSQNYGRPEDLKQLIDAAHARNLMVLLDVVYNHFGPEGNYLWLYSPQFFTDRHCTPWGAGINFDGAHSRTVRDYFIHNALYWLQEYHLDGLRLDAVHAIADDSRPDILTELAETVRRATPDRHIHLVLENDDNAARYLERDRNGKVCWYDAQWNDDAHHAFHVLLTGETDGYYSDYAKNPAKLLARSLAEGFAFQGDTSEFRDGKVRGEPSRHLPPESFISFLQNHDQVANRALGERIACLSDPAALKAALIVFLLAPSPPLLFMGEEFAATTPFLFFCDFGPDLADKVRDGRRAEFSRFEQFSSPEARERIPDPNLEETFLASKLDWSCLDRQPHSDWLNLYRELLALRREKIVPRLEKIVAGKTNYELLAPKALQVVWQFGDGGTLKLIANLGNEPVAFSPRSHGELLYGTVDETQLTAGSIPSVSAAWFLTP